MERIKVGDILKAKRKALNYPVEYVLDELAVKEIKIKKSTLYGYENNQNLPDSYTLMALCEIYGIDDVLSEFGYKKNSPTSEISEVREKALVENYRALNVKGQDYIDETMEMARINPNYKKGVSPAKMVEKGKSVG